MMRSALFIVTCLAILVTLGCSRETPDPIPTPTGIDWEAAAELETDGNGLWILDGPAAMEQVLRSLHGEEPARTSLVVHEMVPVEGGEFTPGRNIAVERVGNRDTFEATFTIGSMNGQLISIGEDAWIRGNEEFMRAHGHEATDSFRCIAANSPQLAEVMPFLDPESVIRTAVTGLQIGVVPPEDSDSPAILTLGADAAPIGTLTVRAHGVPLPQVLSIADESGTVRLDFQWAAEHAVEKPAPDALACD